MPDFSFEDAFALELCDDPQAPEAPPALIGLDEAGRGPLAGPVVAAAVWLDPQACPQGLLGALDDSKRLKAKQREAVFDGLCQARAQGCAAIASASLDAPDIDRLNILQASLLAMARAAAAIAVLPDGRAPGGALVDGNRLPAALNLPARCLVGGDSRSFSIAAASIVAKVERDALMDRLATRHPGYGWEKNRGYGTRDHLAALRRLGPSPEHRRSFRPVREALEIMP